MSFTNAEKGVRIILIAQFFSIASSLFGEIFSFAMTALYNQYIVSPSSISIILSGTTIASSIILFSLLVVTAVMQLVGYIKASRDEISFRRSMICGIVSIVFTGTGSLFETNNAAMSTILSASGMIFELFMIIFSLTGLINLSEKCDRKDLADKGVVLLKVFAALYFVLALNAITIRIFELSSHSQLVAQIIGWANFVINLIGYVLFIVYLSKSSKMLRRFNSESGGV